MIMDYNVYFMETFVFILCCIYKHMQARLVRGTSFVHDTFGQYKTVEEFWDGEIWDSFSCLKNINRVS